MSPPLKIETALPPGSVVLDVDLTSKPLVIAHAADLLGAASGVSSEAIENALLAREAVGSTGVGGGVAMPHARLHLLTRTHAVFLRLAKPIAFEAIDDKPVDLVCAVVAPDEPNADLLTAVSAVSHVLRDAAKTEALRSSGDPEAARRILL